MSTQLQATSVPRPIPHALLNTGARRIETKAELAALSSPCRTYKPGEIEWCPTAPGRTTKPGITVSKRGVGISSVAFRQMQQSPTVAEAVAEGQPVTLNLGYDAMARAVVIQPDPDGRFVISARTSSPKFGGPLTVVWLRERGLADGTHPATWDAEHGRLVVKVKTGMR